MKTVTVANLNFNSMGRKFLREIFDFVRENVNSMNETSQNITSFYSELLKSFLNYRIDSNKQQLIPLNNNNEAEKYY